MQNINFHFLKINIGRFSTIYAKPSFRLVGCFFSLAIEICQAWTISFAFLFILLFICLWARNFHLRLVDCWRKWRFHNLEGECRRKHKFCCCLTTLRDKGLKWRPLVRLIELIYSTARLLFKYLSKKSFPIQKKFQEI